jgi:hypothetical protein
VARAAPLAGGHELFILDENLSELDIFLLYGGADWARLVKRRLAPEEGAFFRIDHIRGRMTG